MAGGQRSGVECVFYVTDLRGSGAGELEGNEVVEGGLVVAGWGDEEASLQGESIRGMG